MFNRNGALNIVFAYVCAPYVCAPSLRAKSLLIENWVSTPDSPPDTCLYKEHLHKGTAGPVRARARSGRVA